jgi:hypothetical protein
VLLTANAMKCMTVYRLLCCVVGVVYESSVAIKLVYTSSSTVTLC